MRQDESKTYKEFVSTQLKEGKYGQGTDQTRQGGIRLTRDILGLNRGKQGQTRNSQGQTRDSQGQNRDNQGLVA